MRAPVTPYMRKSDFAYMLLRDRILAHEYQPGSLLNQAMLARGLGISTTPLREAMRRLLSEGLVEIDAHRDARVTGLSASQARDLLETRMALDPLAVALAAERRTAVDIDRMQHAAIGIRSLPDRPNEVDLVAHREFHRSLYLASHNELLIDTLDGLWDMADRYRLVGLRDSRDLPERTKKADEHRGLLDAVVAGDGQKATEIMREHILTSLGAKAAKSI